MLLLLRTRRAERPRYDARVTAYVIELRCEADAAGIDARALERWAARTLTAEGVAEPAELSVVLADDAFVRELNRTHRQTDAATDVLSFAQSEGERFTRPGEAPAHLGDVVISLDMARRQAAEYRQPLDAEMAHLLVHGILHLLGYDHEQAADEAAMRAREDAILGAAHHH